MLGGLQLVGGCVERDGGETGDETLPVGHGHTLVGHDKRAAGPRTQPLPDEHAGELEQPGADGDDVRALAEFHPHRAGLGRGGLGVRVEVRVGVGHVRGGGVDGGEGIEAGGIEASRGVRDQASTVLRPARSRAGLPGRSQGIRGASPHIISMS